MSKDDDLSEKTWKNEVNISDARKSAKQIKKRAGFLEAHALMLSSYISFFKQQNIAVKILWLIPMSYHAFIMNKFHDRLNYEQLDVLVSFLLKLKLGRNLFFGKQTNILVDQALYLAANNKTSAPSEKALILTTKAMVNLITKSETTDKVKEMVQEALGYEALIVTYEKTLQGYRQFTRVLRKTGEMYGMMGDTESQIKYLKKARDWALGKAQTPDQANKINALLLDLGVED